MFYKPSSFNSPLNKWDISSNKVMAHQFENSRVFNQDISMWKVGAVTTMERIFCDSRISIKILAVGSTSFRRKRTRKISSTTAQKRSSSITAATTRATCPRACPLSSHLEESNGFFGIRDTILALCKALTIWSLASMTTIR